MARRSSHKRAFRAGMRAGALGWRGSAKASDRLNLAKSEIRAVNKADPVTAAEGVVVLAERIWPAFEQIDTSSGALGNAVRRMLEELLPNLIEASADEPIRAHRQQWGRHEIARFCETILVRQGKADEAYRRFGLPSALGNTWLAMWRDLVRRYPNRDARELLEDLIALHGRKGKWFAAAKTAGYFDIALQCAADWEAAPATLIRAARDFEVKNPAFAAQVALHAVTHLQAGRG